MIVWCVGYLFSIFFFWRYLFLWYFLIILLKKNDGCFIRCFWWLWFVVWCVRFCYWCFVGLDCLVWFWVVCGIILGIVVRDWLVFFWLWIVVIVYVLVLGWRLGRSCLVWLVFVCLCLCVVDFFGIFGVVLVVGGWLRLVAFGIVVLWSLVYSYCIVFRCGRYFCGWWCFGCFWLVNWRIVYCCYFYELGRRLYWWWGRYCVCRIFWGFGWWWWKRRNWWLGCLFLCCVVWNGWCGRCVGNWLRGLMGVGFVWRNVSFVWVLFFYGKEWVSC